MHLCIDASNISNGGALTHLVQIMRTSAAPVAGFDRVTVWSRQSTLARLPDIAWLDKRTDPVLERNYLRRALWQRSRLGELARSAGADLLFAPGGSVATSFRPVVTMSRNMLPFDLPQLARFGISPQTVRLLLLRWAQSRSYRAADGTIFLTDYARREVLRRTGALQGEMRIIPHGVDRRFVASVRRQRDFAELTDTAPFRLLYVSIIDMYKNQPQVAEAVAQLRAQGLPVVVDFVGPAYPPALRALRRTLARTDPDGRASRYLGPVPYAELHAAYASADAVLYASSCENMPNILLEGMASGLPIACSNRGPMPEVLGAAGAYFDPQDVASIVATLREFIGSAASRTALARQSFERAQQYSWERCATETFTFLAEVARSYRSRAG